MNKILISVLILSALSLNAQIKNQEIDYLEDLPKDKDTLKIDESEWDEVFGSSRFDKWMVMESFSFKNKKNFKRIEDSYYTIEPSYTQGNVEYTEANPLGQTKFGLVNSFGISIGRTNYKFCTIDSTSILREFSRGILEVRSYQAIDANDTSVINPKATKITLGSANGYGYKFDDSYLSLHTTDASSWAFMDAKNGNPIVQNTFGTALRFGNLTEYGITYQHSTGIGITAGYRQEIVYPRFLWWKSGISKLAEDATIGIIGWATNGLKDKGSNAYPVVNFIVDAGVRALFNHFRKNDMYFPYETASPLIYNSFVIKLSYSIDD